MTRRIRALMITPDYPPAVGGIQLLAHRIVSHFEQIETRVVTIGGPGSGQSLCDDAVRVTRVPKMPNHRLEIALMNAMAVREARRFRPDVVLSAHIVASPAATAIMRLMGTPTVLYVHGKEVGASPGIARFGLHNSSAVIAVSRYTRDLALAAGADDRKIHVIHPGVDWFEAAPRSPRDRPTVLTVARLEDRYKGHDMMVRALPLIRARVPDVEWVVIGDGQLRHELSDLARAYGVEESIQMLGSVSDEERDAWLDQSHVFVMPSRLPAGQAAGEGFGIVYLEAGVHRLPVVAGNVGGACDAVVHGVTGLLVDPTSNLALADAISGLLLDQAASQTMGEAGQRRAREFNWPSISSRVERVLLSLTNRTEATPDPGC